MSFATRHFSSGELGNAPPEFESNSYAVAQQLERARSILGDNPIRVTSGYRSAEDNARVGGTSNSAHLTAQAVDFTVATLTASEVVRRLQAARADGRFSYGELIYDARNEHIHMTLPGIGGDGETLVELPGGKFEQFAAWLTRNQGPTLAVLLLALLLLLMVHHAVKSA